MNYQNLTANLLRLSLPFYYWQSHLRFAVWFCWRFALHSIWLSGIPTTLETRQDRSLDYVLARRMMTRISAAKIICIHNKLLKSQSPNKVTHFRGLLFQLPDIFWFFEFLFGGSLTALVLFSYNRNATFFTNVSLAKKCFCYVIQRQTTFSLHDNPPSKRNCKLLCHSNWAIIPGQTTIEHGRETDTKWTRLLSWKHLTDVYQNFVFEGWLVTAVRRLRAVPGM